MKKLLLSLGALSAVVAPVAAVVACGSTTTSTLSENGKKSLDAYKTQANALSDGEVKTASLTALGKIKSDQDLATFVQSQTGKDLMAAVMAGAGTNGTATVTGQVAKLSLDEANTQISKIISDSATTELTAPVAQKMTGQLSPQEVYPAMATEGDLARQIKLVDGGFTVQIKNTVTKFDETYFIENNEDATVQALIDKLAKNYHSDATTTKAYVAGTPTAFTGVKLAYIDATGQGVALLDAKAVTGFFNMKSAEFDQIEAIIAKLA